MEAIKTNPGITGNEIHKGPSLGMLASVTILIFTLNVLAYNVLTGWTSYPLPLGPAETSRNYFQKFPEVLRISSFLQIGAAITIGIYTATITSLLRFLGERAAGANIAFFGGTAGAAFLALSAVFTWVQSQYAITGDTATIRLVQLAGFASGGVIHVAFLGLLLAGISVPCLLHGLLPKWLCWLGLVTAALSELASLSFIFPSFFILLPVARFASLLWLVVTGFKIAKHRVIV